MLVIRAYSVMDLLMVEVTCAGHGDGEQGAHMVYRTGCPVPDFELATVLEVASEALVEAYHRVDRGEVASTDDCAFV